MTVPSGDPPRGRSSGSRTSNRSPAIAGLDTVCNGVIYDHVFKNADREVGGVLVGQLPDQGGAPTVTGAIEAFWADERAATLTFTQDAWEEVHTVLEAEFPPGTHIAGWYHSHPGYGIFLSEPDLFIHRHFFGSPSQIALVVDPLGAIEGVFAWRNGEVRKLYERSTPPNWTASAVPHPTTDQVSTVPAALVPPPAPDYTVPPPARHRFPALSELAVVVGVFLLVLLIGALIGVGLSRIVGAIVFEAAAGIDL